MSQHTIELQLIAAVHIIIGVPLLLTIMRARSLAATANSNQ